MIELETEHEQPRTRFSRENLAYNKCLYKFYPSIKLLILTKDNNLLIKRTKISKYRTKTNKKNEHHYPLSIQNVTKIT
jgi:hypothetical protein